MVPQPAETSASLCKRAANGGINDSRVAATRLPNDRLVWSAEPYSAPETQLNIAGSSKVPSREVRQANRAVRRIELPDCGKHGPQGRLSAVGAVVTGR